MRSHPFQPWHFARQALIVVAACNLAGCYQYSAVDPRTIEARTTLESARVTPRGGDPVALTAVSVGPDSVVGYDGQQLRLAFARGEIALVEHHRLHVQNTVLATLGAAVLGLSRPN